MKLLRIAFLALAACMGMIVAVRMLIGPFHFSWLRVTVPLNPVSRAAECATGAPALRDWMDGVPTYANGKQECIDITRTRP